MNAPDRPGTGAADADSVRAMLDRGDVAGALRQADAGLARPDGGSALRLARAAALAAAGRYDEALEDTVIAGEQAGACDDTATLVDALSQAGAVLRATGDPEAAVQTLQHAESLAQGLGDALRLARVLRNLGVTASLLGQHAVALQHLGEAVRALERHADAGETRHARLSLLNARNRQLETLDAAWARAEAKALLPAWQRLAEEFEANDQARLALMAWGNHAITLRVAGQAQAAADALAALAPRYRAAGMRPNEALGLAEQSRCLEDLGDVPAAHQQLALGVQQLRAAGVHDDLVAALAGLARLSRAMGRPDEAEVAEAERQALVARRTDEAAREALAQRHRRRLAQRLAQRLTPGAPSTGSPALRSR